MARRWNLMRVWGGLAAILVTAAAVAVTVAIAQERPASGPRPANASRSAFGEEANDPFAVPKNATPAELVKFIDAAGGERVRTVPELRRQAKALDEAASALLAAKGVDDATTLLAVRTKFHAYGLLRDAGDEAVVQKALDFLAKLKTDQRPAVVLFVAEVELMERAGTVEDMTAKERARFVEDLFAHLAKVPLDKHALGIAVGVAEVLEDEDEELAADVYSRLAPLFAKSKDAEVREYAVKMAGVARRLKLPGNPIDVVGTTLDGQPFDWAKYRGKVVLLDFWATWCGPCVAELPNVRQNYERYHDKGFEVVGISLDDDRDQLVEFLKEKKLPWVTLFSKDEATRGWEHPTVVKYGISGIPTVILVDQKGNVVDLNARGPKLGKLLEQLLGPAGPKRGVEKTATKPPRGE